MKHSIQGKILKLTISALLFCTLLVGGFGIFFANATLQKSAGAYLKSISEKETAKISGRLESLEQYVNMLAYSVLDGLNDIQQLKKIEAQEAFTQKNYEFISSTINNTKGAVAVYLRYNPAFTPSTSGIFMAKTTIDGEIERVPVTDFSKFRKDDIEHVGWYYIPVRSGVPIWMEPYKNKNIDIYMISYVVPLFKFKEEIGVVGIDVDFAYLSKEIASIRLFKTGYAYLENSEGKIAYHPDVPNGKIFQPTENLISIKSTLQNGMKLVLVVPRNEIQADRNTLILQIAISATMVLILFIIISIFLARSITKPLKILTSAANKMTAGDLDVTFNINSNDEVGNLAKSFDAAKASMKEYLHYVHKVAYKDSLTGAHNQSAFENDSAELENALLEAKINEFGILALHIDSLKNINDNYGHEHGNMLVINAYKLLLNIFNSENIYRTTSNAFIVILKGYDYKNRELQLENLQKAMANTQNAENAWDKVSLTHGLATYNTEDTVKNVLKRAFAIMEQNKDKHANS